MEERMRKRYGNNICRVTVLALCLLLFGCGGNAKEETGQTGGMNQTETANQHEQANQPDRTSQPGQANQPSQADGASQPGADVQSDDLSGDPLPDTPARDYMTMVETALEGIPFRQMEKEETVSLEEMFLGHYDVTGRAAEDGMEYYVALRREDAPEYEDYHDLSVSYISDAERDSVLQIGYYDEQITEKILYELPGYELMDFPLGTVGLSGFCLLPNRENGGSADQAFTCAFTESGRDKLSFMKKWPGLSFYNEGDNSIQFYYQDEDTLKFYSEPYPCYISFSDAEAEKLRNLLSCPWAEEGITTASQASCYLDSLSGNKGKDGAGGTPVQSTGAAFFLDGQYYVLYGNGENSGYLWASSETGESQSIGRNQEVYEFVMEKLQNVTGLDYRDFDPEWFAVPLKSASLAFPEWQTGEGTMGEGTTGEGTTREEENTGEEIRRQTVTDRESLDKLGRLLDGALRCGARCGISKCPYKACLDLEREDGEKLRIYLATDSCDSMAYEGRIGLQYGDQREMAEIFPEAMAARLER